MEQIEMTYERDLLSDREFEIVEELVFKGTKKEAAVPLGITVRTVETQTKFIYKKIGITKLNELTLWYCAVKFNIAKQIEIRKKEIKTGIQTITKEVPRTKKEVGTGILSLMMLASLTFDHCDVYFRTRRYRRRMETEQTESQIDIHGA
ncbi:hypothetical protein G7051_17425 [Dysgonomonas sp. HDW5B]|uniref:helix-turn-helix transcriptional regulator n=1 Tax=Dysgonomonas sp. HDW5B TaxID=2714927 RepID=UPI00140B1433|nr:LuxR C-terminal-related transcriptional regulator [Dysgonomonas sp. HDW5B]QIK56042.1 hypothetical protein G7051_17425 [Dysgonomonas sp. HDW5B]